MQMRMGRGAGVRRVQKTRGQAVSGSGAVVPAPISVILTPGTYFISAVAGTFSGPSHYASFSFGYTLTAVSGAASSQETDVPTAAGLFNWVW